MKRHLLFTGLICLTSFGGYFAARGRSATPTAVTSSYILWETDLDKAHQLSLKTGKPILIVFGASWCDHCRKLTESTLTEPGIVAYINKTFIPVGLEFDKNKRTARVLEVESLPTSLVLTPKADLVGRIVGHVDTRQYHNTLERAIELKTHIEQVRLSSDRLAIGPSNR
jgi:thioredoxin-like negative regulator of GroEL